MSALNLADPDQTIYIQPRELTGTRQAKLEELDTLLAQLQVIRLVLCGQAIRVDGCDRASPDRLDRHRHPVWRRALGRVLHLFGGRS